MTIADQVGAALSDRYRVEGELGSGGMATVLLAHDARHDRHVAIKVLHPELAAVVGAERFLAEIRTTARLQHPHILPLLDSGEAQGWLYYVMPVVDGESLRARLTRETQLPIDEAVRLAQEVASALDYAHRHGVVHRDIKPENILLHDGSALVADFGIALAISNAGANRLTQTGLSLGTPHYMSPEQAMGERHIDARADIYSLGCVLYEMLAGEPPFTGPSAQAVIAQVITSQPPPLESKRSATPGNVVSVTGRALQKLPADRFSSAAEFADALRRPGSGPLATLGPPPVVSGGSIRRRAWSRLLAAVGGSALVAFGLGFWTGEMGMSRSEARLLDLDVPLPPGLQPAAQEEIFGPAMALSPDGLRAAFAASDGLRPRIFIRDLGSRQSNEVAGAEGGRAPQFTADGRWLVYPSVAGVMRSPVGGGTAAPLPGLRGSVRGLALLGGDSAVISSGSHLFVASLGGGERRPLTQLDSQANELSHRLPYLLPNGRHVLFTSVASETTFRIGIKVAAIRSGEVRALLRNATTARYMEPGILLYATMGGDLLAAPFDLRRLEVGAPVKLADSLAVDHGTGTAHFAVSSAGGSVIYARGTMLRTLAVVDRTGGVAALPVDPRPYVAVRVSPQGDLMALVINKPGVDDLWLLDPATRTPQRLTWSGNAQFPAWSPEGSRIAISLSGRTLQINVTGSGELVQLHETGGERSWMGDGRIVHSRAGDLWLIDERSGGEPGRLLATPYDEAEPAISPDGRWVAFTSTQSGRAEVYVRSMAGGRAFTVSTDGGFAPRWPARGGEIFYRVEDRIVAVPIVLGPDVPRMGKAVVVFDRPVKDYDVYPDGRRLVVILPPAQPLRLVVLVNAREEILRRFAERK